jgi:hypothetical protein
LAPGYAEKKRAPIVFDDFAKKVAENLNRNVLEEAAADEASQEKRKRARGAMDA